jgi:hypothetical protein
MTYLKFVVKEVPIVVTAISDPVLHTAPSCHLKKV